MENSAQVAVIGSYGVGMRMNVPRIPVKGETLTGSGFVTFLGGKGSNQAVGVARLGITVELLACIGSDSLGEGALELWQRESVNHSAVVKSVNLPTPVGFIMLDPEGDNCIAIDAGANAELSPDHVKNFAPVIQRSQIAMTQLEIPVVTAEAALRIAQESGVKTILNPAPAQLLSSEMLSLVDILTPNQSEARILVGLTADDLIEDEAVAKKLLDRGVKTVVMTLGEKGALIVSSEGLEHHAGHPVKVVDTTGAGDGFNAALAAGIVKGLTLSQAVKLANHAGARMVATDGVIPALPTRMVLEV